MAFGLYSLLGKYNSIFFLTCCKKSIFLSDFKVTDSVCSIRVEDPNPLDPWFFYELIQIRNYFKGYFKGLLYRKNCLCYLREKVSFGPACKMTVLIQLVKNPLIHIFYVISRICDFTSRR